MNVPTAVAPYFPFVQKVGREKAAAVLHRVSWILGPFPGAIDLRDRFIQRAGELFGSTVLWVAAGGVATRAVSEPGSRPAPG